MSEPPRWPELIQCEDEDPDEFLESLLEDLLSEGSEDMAAFLKAYFDESERFEDRGVFAVAGLAFAPGAVREFLKEWRDMLGPMKYFHMVDLQRGRNEFKGMPRRERFARLREAVGIINRHRLFAVAVSCSPQDFKEIRIPKETRGMRTPYGVCAHFCMCQVGNWLKRNSASSTAVAYFFEDGHTGSTDIRELLAVVGNNKAVRQTYQRSSDTFLEKADLRAIPIQAADILVWHYAKFRDADLPATEITGRCWELLSGNQAEFVSVHLGYSQLRDFLGLIQDIEKQPPEFFNSPDYD
ncbi:MAG TPA: DUF3800 domain-containing protein [Thermoanaerobaculia bacterium]|nr:DUF3800 domain-containing protein [Thermoanaerobaculia bacterium]